MASALGFHLVGCLAILSLCSATVAPSQWPTPRGKPVRVSNLPPPPVSGVLGLSRLIVPIYQANQLRVHYPYSQNADPVDRVSYEADVQISFNCTQATRWFVININPQWELYPIESIGDVAVREVFFNPIDDTLIIDLEENLKVDTKYYIQLKSGKHVIDEDDKFGIQAFNRTSEDTGESQITIGLSPAPKSLRRLIPYFDDPAYQVEGYWWVSVHNGPHAHALVLIKGEIDGVYHMCEPTAPPSVHYGQYYYVYPKMAAEAMTFRIVPFAWYQGDDITRPDDSCH